MTKYTINCDWFELIFSGHTDQIKNEFEVYLAPDLRLTFWDENYSTRFFKKIRKLFINNKHWATICSEPPANSILKQNTFSFQLANERLYEVGWLDLVKLFVNHFGFKYEGTTRLDICLDGHGFLDIVNRVVLGELKCVSRAGRSVKFTPKMEVEGFRLGTYASDRSVKVYNKTKELSHSNKWYIKKHWERAKLDLSADVERLEVTLRNQYVKLTKGYDWERLDDFEYLASIMRTSLFKYWEFRENREISNVSRLVKTDFIDWSALGGVMLERLSATMPSDVFRLKQAAKTDFFIYLQTKEQFRADLCVEKLKNINCLQWFYEREESWRREFDRRNGKNRNGEISFKYISEFKQYKPKEQLVFSV
jgi:hypothetical protein